MQDTKLKERLSDRRLIIYVTGEQRDGLEKVSAETGARLTELVRRAIDAYLAGRKG